jgi:hypothetical protein
MGAGRDRFMEADGHCTGADEWSIELALALADRVHGGCIRRIPARLIGTIRIGLSFSGGESFARVAVRQREEGGQS